jgi:hypothetical protein
LARLKPVGTAASRLPGRACISAAGVARIVEIGELFRSAYFELFLALRSAVQWTQRAMKSSECTDRGRPTLRRHAGSAATFALVTSLVVSTAWADTTQRVMTDQELDQGQVVEPLAKTAQADGAVVTYTGLRVHDDGSATLRVELSKKVAVQKSAQGTEVRFFLPGARITVKNNKNPLLAQHFATNVVSAEIQPSKAGVTVVVRLRQAVALEPQLIDQAGGASTVRVDIPAPSKATAPTK